MPKIIQLDRHVADLIAAGEVVERPASAVKELVENSIDAGAKNITIELQNGGMTFLRITDDGCGMDPVDARTAFLRHATSKIRRQEDLACIGTLGFRGEALAAISSVSKIDLLTRAQGAENGVRLHLEAGKVLSEEPVGCPCGTTILVRELFYNTPARMKFMKSDAAESSAVFSVVQQQALAHPEISFRFLKDGQEQLHTDGQGDRMAAIYAIYGRELANNMLPVDGSWEKLRVRGFVTKPTATRGNRAWQSFFVNNRYIKSRLLSAAVEEAYRNQIMVGRFPACVLEIDMPVQAAAVLENKALLERCGFETEDFGGGDVLIRQIPSDVDVEDAKALLQELAGDLLAGKTLDPDSLRDNLLHTIACKSAIKAGWQTSDEELRRLVQEVLSRDDIKYCPHGRPVCVTLTKRQLEKQFKRV